MNKDLDIRPILPALEWKYWPTREQEKAIILLTAQSLGLPPNQMEQKDGVLRASLIF